MFSQSSGSSLAISVPTLRLSSTMVRTVLVIGGMGSTSNKDHAWLAGHGEAVRALFGYDEVRVWCPEHGWNCKKEWAPYANSREDCVDACEPSSVWANFPWLYAEAERLQNAIVVAFSNGCVMATELQRWYADRIDAVIFASGVPGAADAARLLGETPCVFTCGSDELFFGGAQGLQRVAEAARAPALAFQGSHCWEPVSLWALLPAFIP